jgi:hypothetical protein
MRVRGEALMKRARSNLAYTMMHVKTVPFKRVDLGPCGDEAMFGSARFFVLGSASEFEEVYPGRDRGDLPAIDFKNHLLIVAYRGICPTGGYTIEITCVHEAEDGIHVQIETKDPNPDDFVTLAMTNPHDAVVIPRKSIASMRKRAFVFHSEEHSHLATVNQTLVGAPL